MNFIKKMCILRQVKQGFSGDGKTLSGLIKIEQYGKNLSVEVSVINFAPLSSGEYYCLIADSKNRTEMLPLRGKSLFNIVSELDAEDGFCGVICFVKNGITPIAYGIHGNKVYDWKSLVKRSVPPRSREPACTDNAGLDLATGTATGMGGIDFGFGGEAAEEPFLPDVQYDEKPEKLHLPENEKEPPREETNKEITAKNKGKYDDETVATENYYDREAKKNERIEHEQAHTYAHAESGNQDKTEKERTSAQTDGDAENIRNPFTTDSDGYYFAVKGEIDELFAKYPADDSLKNVFAFSEWVRVRGEEGKAEYLIGVIYDDMKAKYICYALPAADKENPPEEIKEICTFVPSSAFTDKEGFFVIFQSCSTGECIRPESM